MQPTRPHPLTGKEILFTRQRHDAKRAGLHWDYRLVLGDKAYSWATKKELPEPGKAIILFETPVHDAVYALRKRIYIPPGQYGSGTTTLDFVRKAKVDQETEPGKIVFSTRDGERYLIKRLDETKYGQASWLFKNLTEYKEGKDSTFTHDGNDYSVDEALAQVKGQKSTPTKVSNLDWILEHGTPDQKRLDKADLKFPLLATSYQDKLAVVDGYHRLAKAKQEGIEELPVRFVDTSKLNKYTRQILKEAALSAIGQALDNKSEDFHYENGNILTDETSRIKNYSRLSKIKKSKGYEHSSHGLNIKKFGKDYLAELDHGVKDNVGRTAPLNIVFNKEDVDGVKGVIHKANNYHKLDNVTGWDPHRAHTDIRSAIDKVDKMARNRLLKRVGLGVGIIGLGALGAKLYLNKKQKEEGHGKQAALSELESRFKPDLTPDQMERLGVLRHKGSQYGEGAGKDNFFGVSASMPTWPDKWHNEEHPQGWYQWYKGYSEGKRTSDDERQIKRWLSFKARHLAQLQKADPTLENLSVQPKRRQALLNWAIGPGIKLEKEAGMNKYLVKIAKKEKSNVLNRIDDGVTGLAAIGIGAGLTADSPGDILGYKTVYHGTHKKNVDSIKKHGLQPSQSRSNPFGEMARKNAGKVPNHDDILKNSLAGMDHDKSFVSSSKAQVRQEYVKPHGKDGAIVKLRIPSYKYNKMHTDSSYGLSGDARHYGTYTRAGVPASYVKGGSKYGIHNYLNKNKILTYLGHKENRITALTGIGKALGGAALIGIGGSFIKDAIKPTDKK